MSADVSVRERMVRRLDGLGTLVICTDLTELQAMIGPPMVNGPASLLSPAPPGADNASAPAREAAAREAAAPEAAAREAAAEAAPAVRAAAAPGAAAAPVPAVISGRISLHDLEIYPHDHLVTWRGERLSLTRLERNLLTQLATAPVGVWTYQQLFESVWGCAFLGDTSSLHSAVKRLRRKLHAVDDALRVHTVRGVGYRLSVD
ncbi:winged helix-turn-helix domain-containing protein [Micromonospora sp. NPDC047644]|uniref:winged helix-turn-helix domain-containing protein n=1 Tax=Micromonospora sp. NPDC047644 TaxID=3157203 RepID=UPI003451C98D